MKLEIEYIKASGKYYYPQEAGEQHHKYREGCEYPVCHIKKLAFGRWQIDFHDFEFAHEGENKPNARLILHPSGIDEVKFIYIDS